MKNLYVYYADSTVLAPAQMLQAENVIDIKIIAEQNHVAIHQLMIVARNVLIVGTYFNKIKPYLLARLSKGLSTYIQINTKVPYTRQVKSRTYCIESFEDINRFDLNGDFVSYIVEQEHKMLRLETQAIIEDSPVLSTLYNQCNQDYLLFEDTISLLLSAQSDELASYEIDSAGTSVPNIMKSIFVATLDSPYLKAGECTCHNETRTKYSYELTLKDKCLMYMQLDYYKSHGIQPMKRVYIRNGHELVCPNNACDITECYDTSGIFTYLTEQECD